MGLTGSSGLGPDVTADTERGGGRILVIRSHYSHHASNSAITKPPGHGVPPPPPAANKGAFSTASQPLQGHQLVGEEALLLLRDQTLPASSRHNLLSPIQTQ